MALYDKEKEDRTLIPKSEYRHLIKLEEQVEHLYRRRRQILAEAEEDKAKGYNFEPKISISEIDLIFNFLSEPMPFEATKDDIEDALGYTE
jgi:hypothetical protein